MSVEDTSDLTLMLWSMWVVVVTDFTIAPSLLLLSSESHTVYKEQMCLGQVTFLPSIKAL